MADAAPITEAADGWDMPPAARSWLLAITAAAVLLAAILPAGVAWAPVVLAGACSVLLLALRATRGHSWCSPTFALLGLALAIELAGVGLGGILASRAGSAAEPDTVGPFTFAALGYALAAPFLIAAVIGMPQSPDRRHRLRAVVDTCVAALAFGLVVWQSLAVTQSDDPAQSNASWTSLLISVVAALVATSIVWMLSHSGDETGLSAPVAWWWSAAAFLGVLAAIVAGRTVDGPYDRAALMLLAVSAGAFGATAIVDPRGRLDLNPPQVLRRQRIAVLAPMVPLIIAATVMLTATLQGRTLPTASLALSVALLFALVISTLLARLESLDVSSTLEHRVAERTLALGSREKWFSGLVQNSSDVITVVDVDGTIRYQTPSCRRVLGHDPDLLVGNALLGLLRPDDGRTLLLALADAAASPTTSITLEIPIWHREGRWCDTETTVTSLLHDPRIRGVVLNTRDVSERRRLEEALTKQAFSDALTGLANRALFRDSVDEALATSPAGQVALVFMDLNGFKAVNDSQGHAVGDHLLSLVGQRLRNCVRPGDVVARLGGDEFAVLVAGERAEAGAVWVADRVRRVLAGNFVLDNRSVTLGAAIGIAVNDDGDETADQLLRNADLAMYRAKAAQRSEFLRFEASMHDDLVARVDAEKDLRRAVERGELRLHYQPLVDLRTGDVVGAEALARWYHPERGFVSPTDFIELAEETGLVEQIGAWALHEAATAAASWQHFAPAGLPFRVAVNVSARQVGSGLPRTVRDALTASGLPAGALTLEMTESVLMERPDEAAAILARLKTLGVRIAVDDFGTGYSSLSYLSRFPVDVLKIDRSFIEHVDRDSEPSELVRTMVQLGTSLNLVTVAEGIETPAQRDAVAAMGCTLGQGYLFSKAMPAERMATFLSERLLAHA